MQRHYIEINDLHRLVRQHGSTLGRDGAHFNETGIRILAEAVAKACRPSD